MLVNKYDVMPDDTSESQIRGRIKEIIRNKFPPNVNYHHLPYKLLFSFNANIK
jgi:hypothetical protein